MPTVSFTNNLKRHLACPQVTASGDTVRQVLNGVIRQNPNLEGYILDDQGRLRQHMNIFVDGVMIQDRDQLSDAVTPNSELYVLQALSGG